MDIKLNFAAPLWKYPGKSAWHFVNVPKSIGDQIKSIKQHRKGFGSVRVRVKIGMTIWRTSVFPDKNTQSYLLPIKAAIRIKENLSVNDELTITLFIDL